MKKLTWIFPYLFLLLFLYPPAISFSQGFTSVFSKDGLNVIAVGGNTIYRSSDGGATWGSTTVASSNFTSVWANGSKIWISNLTAEGVYTSTDNGATWTTYNVPGKSEVYGICFNDGNTGWLAGSNGIFKTTNGGLSWLLHSAAGNVFVSVRFADALKGVACNRDGGIVYTTNGGENWLTSTIPNTGKQLHTVDIKGNLAIATGEDAFILKSTDAGATWSYIDYEILTRSDVWGVSIIDANSFYSCGGGGFIRKSTNAGNTYSFQPNPMMADLRYIYFYDSTRGWAVSSLNKAVLRTSDGGVTWALPNNTSINMSWSNRLSASGNIGNTLYLNPKNKKGMFVVSGSAVYRSPDVGVTWSQIATISFAGNAHSFYVNPNDTNIFLASIGTSSGRVVKSTDHGATWASVWGPGLLTSYGMPLEMDPNHPDTVYLSPSGSVLLRSTDFGSTWSNWSTFTFYDMCDMLVMYKSSNIMYLSDQLSGGKFYKSTDYGLNWTFLFSPGGAEIPMIAASNLEKNRLFFTNWGGSGFWRSTNGGINWAIANSGSSSWGADIAKDDPTTAAYGNYSGSIFITTNGGDNFTATNLTDPTNTGMYFFDKGNLLAQELSGVYKLIVTYDVPLSSNQISNVIPKHFSLEQNYPNPFNPSTLIRYDAPKQANVKIQIFDLLGRLVSTPVDKILGAGEYEFDFNANNLASGIYYYKLESDGFSDVKKMVLVK